VTGPAVASDRPPFTLVRAARLLDGTGAPALESAALLLEGGRIAALGRQAEVRAPEGASVAEVDHGDATILPGLVDAHTHLVAPGDGTPGEEIAKEEDDILLLQAARNARTVLHSGVTTIRENGAKNRVAFSLREGIRRGLAAGPRMVICGRAITITGGHLWYFGSEADGEDGVRAEVRRLLKQGADYIKIMATGGTTRTSDPNRPAFTVRELRAITDEAHGRGKLAAAHCTSSQGVTNCLDAEVDMIIHCVFNEADGTYRFRPDLVERLLAASAWVNPTLYVMRVRIERLEARREASGPLAASEAALLEWSRRAMEARFDGTYRMAQAGVRITAGSDSPWGFYGPGEFVHEVSMLVEAGLPCRDALVAATSGAADSIGAGQVAGRLEPGRPADVLVVGGDPLRDIRALWDVRDVYQGGVRIDRAVR
jgi:imidazolonepropionase-like amidohydrolase